MATGLLKQPQWGSRARAHKHVQAFKYNDSFRMFMLCSCFMCRYGLQEGMSQDYYSHANANSGEKQ